MAAPLPILEQAKEREFAQELLSTVEALTLDIADITGHVREIVTFVSHQQQVSDQIRNLADKLRGDLTAIDAAGKEKARTPQTKFARRNSLGRQPRPSARRNR